MRVRFKQTCNDFDKGEEVECTREELRRFRPECYTIIEGDQQETGDLKDTPPRENDAQDTADSKDTPPRENDERDTADSKDMPPPAEKTTTAARARRTTAVK